MRGRLILFLAVITTMSCAQKGQDIAVQKNDAEKVDSVFTYNFKLLDTFVKNGKTDSGSQTLEAMRFMERTTGIKSSGSFSYVGKLTFSKEDLTAWHKWFDENRNNLSWDPQRKEVLLRK